MRSVETRAILVITLSLKLFLDENQRQRNAKRRQYTRTNTLITKLQLQQRYLERRLTRVQCRIESEALNDQDNQKQRRE